MKQISRLNSVLTYILLVRGDYVTDLRRLKKLRRLGDENVFAKSYQIPRWMDL